MIEVNERRRLDLSIAPAPITEPVTKFGGQPVWIFDPQWPIAQVDGEPMQFIGQFRLPGDELRVAYLFMSEDDSGETWEPAAGDNALIVQGPGSRIPDFLTVRPESTGPTVGADVAAGHTPGGDINEAFMGGEPSWLQGDETPEGDWRFLFQMTDGGPGFDVNFGDVGVGYGFVTDDLCEGIFLWQCH